eukprot:scaffold15557_cov48-Phaeocystis_antarctica.AAC.1
MPQHPESSVSSWAVAAGRLYVVLEQHRPGWQGWLLHVRRPRGGGHRCSGVRRRGGSHSRGGGRACGCVCACACACACGWVSWKMLELLVLLLELLALRRPAPPRRLARRLLPGVLPHRAPADRTAPRRLQLQRRHGDPK